MESLFEVLMVVSFGISWPLNIVKAWKSRSSKGISVLFYFFIWIGYVFGLVGKAVKYYNGGTTPIYVCFFYVLNLIMVSVGIAIYYRNVRIDRQAEK